MKPLKREDALHLEAAEGWLELGNHVEANEEGNCRRQIQTSHRCASINSGIRQPGRIYSIFILSSAFLRNY
jgi:hypothetical protein